MPSRDVGLLDEPRGLVPADLAVEHQLEAHVDVLSHLLQVVLEVAQRRGVGDGDVVVRHVERNVAFLHRVDDRLHMVVAERDVIGDRDRAVGGQRHDIGRGAGGWRRRQRRSVEPVAGGDIEGLLGIENRASCT